MKIFSSKPQKIGKKGEDIACSNLKNAGYNIIERNVANKFGEIDIIAKKRGKTYFFEVKSGTDKSVIRPEENLSKVKLKKFYKSIEYYCYVNKIVDYTAQAIIVVFLPNENNIFEIYDLD